MLVVLETKIGTYEISDQFRNEDRDRYVQYRLINRTLLIISIFLFISQLIVLFDEIKIYPVFGMLLGIAGMAITIWVEIRIKRHLPQEIAGFVLEFDEQKKLLSIQVRKWKENSINEFMEIPVRFNQAIGFQAILDETGMIIVEIIVDPDFPGKSIFYSYDFYTIAELVVLFQKAIPVLDKWFYKMEKGEAWPSEYKKEFNEEVLVARVPWIIQDFINS